MPRCGCTTAHLNRPCQREATTNCLECSLPLCEPCDASRWDKELTSMPLCAPCYRQVTGREVIPLPTINLKETTT